LVAGYLGPAIGWRNCFYALGALGLALSALMLLVRETPRHHQAPAAGDQGLGVRAILRTLAWALRHSPALGLTIAGGVALHFILGAAAFDQLWYVHERGFERAHIAQATGWLGMAGGILGNLFGGWGGDWWQRRTGRGRPLFLFWLLLVFAPLNIAYRLAPGTSIFFWIGVFVGYFQLGAFYGPTFSTIQELVPAHIRATVVAFYILLLNLIGLGFGISGGGVMIDALIEAGHPAPYTVTLLTFAVLSMLAMPLFFLAGRRFFADRERLYRTHAPVLR
jgi:predicted MFS family arabinose efflux permease